MILPFATDTLWRADNGATWITGRQASYIRCGLAVNLVTPAVLFGGDIRRGGLRGPPLLYISVFSLVAQDGSVESDRFAVISEWDHWGTEPH
jgi:hypothetical protein